MLFESYPDVVTPSDIQSMLHIGRNAVYGLLRDGKIAAIRVGKKYIIPKSSVSEFLRLHSTPQNGIIEALDDDVIAMKGE